MYHSSKFIHITIRPFQFIQPLQASGSTQLTLLPKNKMAGLLWQFKIIHVTHSVGVFCCCVWESHKPIIKRKHNKLFPCQEEQYWGGNQEITAVQSQSQLDEQLLHLVAVLLNCQQKLEQRAHTYLYELVRLFYCF